MPSGIVTTAWPRVVAQCREMGVEFDPWQHGIGQIALGKREDGKYAATVGGIVLSIPRQVGKTFLVGMIVIALCALHPGMTVLWSAHRTRTATKTFGSLKGMTSRKKIAPFMLDPRNANGEQEIRFKNGSVIMFGAREQGFGRGFDEVDVEVFDEAQILTEKALEDMVAATNQSRHEAGALLFFMGTPPRPGDPGEEFSNRRQDAIDGTAEDMVYVEFSADPDASPDDWSQIAKANPSHPLRTPREAILRMRKNLTNVDSFMREGLGVWDAKDAGGIPLDLWEKRTDSASTIVGPVVFAAEMSTTRAGATIAAAGRRPDGKVHVELVRQGRSSGWLLDELVRLGTVWDAPVLIDSLSPAASLIPALEEAGVDFLKTTAGDMVKACGSLHDGVHHGEIAHLGDPIIAKVLPTAGRRDLMGGWAWDRKKSGDIAPLVAITLAAYGVLIRPDTKAQPQIHEWPDEEELTAWEGDDDV